MRAEAQDGSGTNNANFGTPPDGPRPRMQMFVWTHPRPNVIHVASGPAARRLRGLRPPPRRPASRPRDPSPPAWCWWDDGVVGVPGCPPAGLPGTVNDGCEPF